MALTDYKYRRIVEHDDGTVEAVAAVYEGDITTEQEEDVDGNLGDITRYRRTFELKEVTKIIAGNPTKTETDTVLNTELAKDVTRTSINEQKNV